MNKNPSALRRLLLASLLALGLSAPAFASKELPGEGITVRPVQTSLVEETFQTVVVSRALEKLGYNVEPIRELEPTTSFLAIANGDVTFTAGYWQPLQDDFYEHSGGDAKLSREGLYSAGAVQGYMIDRKTAEQYHITNIAQLKDPAIAKLFDNDGDGKADLTGCNPGWGCERAIEKHLMAFGLRETVSHKQGTYAALLADTIARYKEGKPILYYAWTPYWVHAVLRPGQDSVWLQTPDVASDDPALNTRLPNGKNYGFLPNEMKILANKKFVEQNPAAATLFEEMKVPLADINAQNLRLREGANTDADIKRQADGWIRAHQKQFDGWIEAARAAAVVK